MYQYPDLLDRDLEVAPTDEYFMMAYWRAQRPAPLGPFSLHGQQILDILDILGILDFEALLKRTPFLRNMLPDLILEIGNETFHR